MTDARRKVKIALLEQNRTFNHLVAATKLSPSTIHNILDGRTKGRKSKQSVTNALRVQVWPDVPVTERSLTLPTGTEIECETVEQAIEGAHELGSNVTVKGKSMRFTLPTRVTVSISDGTRTRSECRKFQLRAQTRRVLRAKSQSGL